jgi:hypothetical protein
MATVNEGIEATNNFIVLAKEIAKLPALILPQYKAAAKALYEICQKLLNANERTANLLYRFRSFDFRSPSARSEFLDACKEFNKMKTSGELNNLKFSCHDIRMIYRRDIQQKVGRWFTDPQKLEAAKGIFEQMGCADEDMVSFIVEKVVGRINAFIKEVDDLVGSNHLNEAEKYRLRFKTETGEIALNIEYFNNELSDLVMKFSEIAGVPLTLT